MSASNLRILDVHVAFGGPSHSIDAKPPKVFQFEKSDRFPPLVELKIYCNSYCFSIENWTAWFACMDWTRLCRLDFDTAYQAFFIRHFHGKLPALRAVKIGVHTVEEVEELDGFLTALDQLEELHIHTFIFEPCFPKLALVRHGPCSLTHLGYLSATIIGSSRSYQFISAGQIDELNKQCPKLESLEIDLRFDQGWPFSAMSSLARFPCLYRLKVRFDMSATNIWQKDLSTNILIAKSLFAFTRQKKKGVPLLTMDFIVRLNQNFSVRAECSRNPKWPMLATIRCKVGRRDDGTEDTVVNSWDNCLERHEL